MPREWHVQKEVIALSHPSSQPAMMRSDNHNCYKAHMRYSLALLPNQTPARIQGSRFTLYLSPALEEASMLRIIYLLDHRRKPC